MRRVAVTARGLHRLLRAAGWIRIWGTIWKPRGKITMRDLGKREGMATHAAMEKERARRHFLKVEDIDREIEKYRIDVVEPHIDALVALLTPNAMRREATKRYLLGVAAELAGENASAVLKMIAVSVVLFDAEGHFASSRVPASAARVGVPHAGLVRWRESAELRMNAKLKTLAYVRSMEESSLQSSLRRLRIAATG